MATEDDEDDQQRQQSKRIKTSHQDDRIPNDSSDDSLSIPALLPEIVVEILLRLPVTSLLQLRSVCKSWRSLISDPQFVKSHLRLSTRDGQYARHRLIFSCVPKVSIKSCPVYDVLRRTTIDAVELDYPLKHPHKSVWIVGSCNGLVCIAIEEDVLFIWNPTTRRSNKLPNCGVKLRSGWYRLYGFGYDESTDDYKVVAIFVVYKNGGSYDTKVKVYSLKSGNWRRIGDFTHGCPLDDSGKFMNGALHWAANPDFRHSSSSWKIISLDLAKETYGEVPQPNYEKGDFALMLGVLGEWLCVLCNYHGNRADVWVMMEYGVTSSWTKLVTIPYLTDPGRDQYSVPLCISEEGEILVLFGSQLVLYDAKSNSFPKIHNLDGCMDACTYVESLVSPDAHRRPWRSQ